MRPATPADAAWIAALLDDEWGGPIMWADERAFDCRELPALVAGKAEGLAVYEVAGARAELVLLEAMQLGRGIGTTLVDALVALLAGQGVRELWLTTTNDNLDAVRFYQRRGFRLAEVRPGGWTSTGSGSRLSSRSATTVSRCGTSCGWCGGCLSSPLRKSAVSLATPARC